MKKNIGLIFFITVMAVLISGSLFVQAAPFPPMAGRTDLALGRKVIFSPAPNYSLTNKGSTNATDLTNGKTSKRKDHRIWWDAKAVGWSYPGRVNMAVDLGKECSINEVAIRLLGGTPVNSANIPGWIQVFVSSDGKHYHQVAEFSCFKKDEFKRFDIPPIKGKAWIDCLRFKNLNTSGRWVGLRIYGSALTVSDELYVFGKPLGKLSNVDHLAKNFKPSGFTVTQPQPYFYKPYLKLATNLALPIPLGLVVPEDKKLTGKLKLTLDFPRGVNLVSGAIGSMQVSQAKKMPNSNGGKSYVFTTDKLHWDRLFGRLYMRADGWHNNQKGILHYSFSHGDWRSGKLSLPLQAVTVKKAPRLHEIMTGLGWWSPKSSLKWPHVLKTWRVLGLNTFPMFGYYIREQGHDSPAWKLMRKARAQGFYISAILNGPFVRAARMYKSHSQIYCHFANGKNSGRWCPTYRGKYYHKMLNTWSNIVARIRPDFSSWDVEYFHAYKDLKTYKKCVECQASYKASGLNSWEKWLQSQGAQMWKGLIDAANSKLQKEDAAPLSNTGGYNFRAGKIYAGTFNFDALYPKWLQISQVSTYTELYPYQISMIGNRVRDDRAHLPKSNVMPWLTVGDAGSFPGSAFKWTLLECFTNGSRGIWFWTRGLWDAEDLIAYNKVIRAIAPVQKIIAQGKLIGTDVRILSLGRLSGMRLGDKMVLLAADYSHKTNGTIKLEFDIDHPVVLCDLLDNGRVVRHIVAGIHAITIPLNEHSARLLEVRPVSDK